MSDLAEFYNSINSNKKNIIRNSDSPEKIEKLYPRYIVNKMLSYNIDAVLYVNELNIRSLEGHNVSNKMAYEFLLNLLSKNNRWSKFTKTEDDDLINIIKERCKYTRDKAKDVIKLLSEVEKEAILKSNNYGGKQAK